MQIPPAIRKVYRIICSFANKAHAAAVSGGGPMPPKMENSIHGKIKNSECLADKRLRDVDSARVASPITITLSSQTGMYIPGLTRPIMKAEAVASAGTDNRKIKPSLLKFFNAVVC